MARCFARHFAHTSVRRDIDRLAPDRLARVEQEIPATLLRLCVSEDGQASFGARTDRVGDVAKQNAEPFGFACRILDDVKQLLLWYLHSAHYHWEYRPQL